MRWILVATGLGVVLAGCTLSELAPNARGVGSRSSGEGMPSADIGGWSVRVSAEPTSIRSLAVSVGPARAVRETGSHPWIQHDLVFENLGRRTVQLTGTRSPAAFIGPAGHRRRLLASSGLCGYAPEGRGSRFTLACLAMLDVTDLKPGAPQTGAITLFKGLRGMEPLIAGTYVFDFRFRIGRPAQPVGSGRRFALKIVYEIQPTLGDGGL